MLLPILMGLPAGLMTTVAGMGGGLVLMVVLAAILGPHEALLLSAPALLVGNLHRAVMMRHSIERRLALPFALGALPGALVGGALVMRLPPLVVKIGIVCACVLALVSALWRWKWTPSRRVLPFIALGTGALSALGVGAGLVVSPVLLGAGLRARAYVGTASVVASALHIGRIGGYAHSGKLSWLLLGASAALAAAITVGNVVGARLDGALDARWRERIHYGALACCALAALAALL
ncbi:MAG: sulfite exporter TauE/SafE family protein [Myxococcales bacterium]|nr:sulfite exporter TauE/SafE family protein [Myxococcales bacterium]